MIKNRLARIAINFFEGKYDIKTLLLWHVARIKQHAILFFVPHYLLHATCYFHCNTFLNVKHYYL